MIYAVHIAHLFFRISILGIADSLWMNSKNTDIENDTVAIHDLELHTLPYSKRHSYYCIYIYATYDARAYSSHK